MDKTMWDIVDLLNRKPAGRARKKVDKKKIMKIILELWLEHPELRLIQLLYPAMPGDPFYLEDWQLVDNLMKEYKEVDNG